MGVRERLQNNPKRLEWLYKTTHNMILGMKPMISRLGMERFERFVVGVERWSKEKIFDCRMCGQCVLHSTGMTCPMSCPKNLRNGACGGVRENGHCEVIPEMKCVWVEAFERSQMMGVYGDEILHVQPPVNRQLEGKSAWVTMLTGEDKDVPAAWVGINNIPVIDSANK